MGGGGHGLSAALLQAGAVLIAFCFSVFSFRIIRSLKEKEKLQLKDQTERFSLRAHDRV